MERRSLYIWLFLFFACVYSFFSIGHYGGDGYEDYLTAESIVLDGDLALNDRPGDPDELAYKEVAGITGRSGRTYSSRGSFGVPVLLALFYAAGHLISFAAKQVPHDYVTMLAVSFYNPLITALTAAVLFAVARRTGLGKKVSLAVAFIFGLATMAPVYARTGFADPTLALFLLLSVYGLILYSELGKIRHLVFSAFCAAYCVFTKVAGLIYLPLLFVYVVWGSSDEGDTAGERVRPVVLYAFSLCFFTALVFLMNYAVYGNPASFGGYDSVWGAKRIIAASHFMKGLYYYLMSTGKGFFFYNLALLPALFAAKKVYGEKRKEAVLFAAIFLLTLLVYAKSFRRGSLFAWGPRYLLPTVPFMALLAGYTFEGLKRSLSRISVLTVTLGGFVIMFPCMLVNQSKFYLFVVEKLKLDEYLINFVPDLSPIKGAWWMLITRLGSMFGRGDIPFVFAPDYRLVKPVSATMEQYNYLDLWYLKIASLAPSFTPAAAGVMFALALLAGVSLYMTLNER